MNISFHTGKSAMIAQGKALDIYGNNIANINTEGYQTLRPDFADCIYETYRRPEADWQTGHGTYIQKTDLMFSESFFKETERPQDMAIAGEGFFAVQDRWGNVNYTRDGKFGITQLDGTWYLVSSQGEYVLDYDKQRIEVPFEEESRNDILARLNWGDVSGRIGTFTSNAPQTNRVRYEYSGEINSDTPARNPNAAKTITPSADNPVESANISTRDGYFAVKDKFGKITYTRDEQLSIQSYEGKWYLGSTSGDFVLDSKNQLIEVDFGEKDQNGNYFTVDWNALSDEVGVFTFAPGDLSTDDKTRYNVTAAADGNIAKQTGNAMLSDLTLSNNEGLFAVEGANGVRYAHNITFDIMQDDTGAWFLSTPQGEYVLDYNNQRIQVSEPQFTNNVDWAGVHKMVGVFQFPNPFGIEALGSNRYLETDRSGAAVACRVMDQGTGEWIYTMDKIPYALITSNVNLADQMVKLIETQRAYQLSSRVVTTSDELARISNNLR